VPPSANGQTFAGAAAFADGKVFADAPGYADGRAFTDAPASGDEQAFGDGGSVQDTRAYPETGSRRAGRKRASAGPGAALPGDEAEGRGFLSALFDFGFTSFVTPKVIKVLYILITIGTVASALVFTIIVFKASVAFGVAILVFGDPLFILIVLAIYRIILEFFVVTFRVAEDIRAIRERGDLR
jgi:hypothetical protein